MLYHHKVFKQAVVCSILDFTSIQQSSCRSPPEPSLVVQLTFQLLLPLCQVDELQIQFIYICLPANVLSAEPASQGHGCVIATT